MGPRWARVTAAANTELCRGSAPSRRVLADEPTSRARSGQGSAPSIGMSGAGPIDGPAEGRCRFELRPGWSYSAWSLRPAQDGGRALATTIRPIAAGGRFELLASDVAGPLRLEVMGLKGWGDVAARRARVFPGELEAPVGFALRWEGATELPLMPAGRLLVEVAASANGEPLHRETAVPQNGMVTVHLGSPSALEMLVTDEAGAPVAGAEVRVGQAFTAAPRGQLPEASPTMYWRLLGATGGASARATSHRSISRCCARSPST